MLRPIPVLMAALCTALPALADRVERTEVRSGLSPGERVVISALGGMDEEQRVRVTYTDPATAAGYNKPKAVNDNFKGFN